MKKIGIVAYKSGSMFGIGLRYANFLSQFGTIIPLLPSKETIDIDLLVLPGGPDMQTINYQEVPGYFTGDSCQFREYFYHNNLKQYIEKGVPVFGICLGFQQLNVMFGGSLFQHDSFLSYSPSDERGKLVEELKFTAFGDKWLRENNIHYKSKKKVNSLHHQGFYKEQMSPQFEAIALSENENVEVFIHKTLPIAGVQFHPEELDGDQVSHKLITNLLHV